ncbi:MAG: hypothetical protein OHK0039_10750 [Bacteroidia bacterium]
MRRLLTLLLCAATGTGLMAQSARIVQPQSLDLTPLGPIDYSQAEQAAMNATPGNQSPSQVPLGTVYSDAVTSIKIGESSNAFTFIRSEDNKLSLVPSVGTTGGSLGFIYRQNIAGCGGVTADNGIYRYSYSTDGGNSWSVGAGTNSAGQTPVAGCYGLGPLNPGYLQYSRYPNGMMILPPGAPAQTSSLGMIYAGAVLSPSGTGWDGAVIGTATGAASATPTITQEDYPYANSSVYFVNSLVERIPGEYFFLSETWDGTNRLGDINVHKGTWSAATNTVNWSIVATVQPDHYLGFDGTPNFVTASIGFSPDGVSGFIAGLADLDNGSDSTLSVFFSESKDGGSTWLPAYEVDMRSFPELIDSLSQFAFIDTVLNDTVSYGRGYPTTGFDLDMVVDKNGNPHAIVTVGNGSIRSTGGGFQAPAYSIFSGVELFMFDVTKDSYGDWNMIYLAYQEFFRGTYGSSPISADPWGQASRSADGRYVFLTWTDTDTANSTDNNNAPDLLGRAIDVDNFKITPLKNFTADDNIWTAKALYPSASPLAIKNGTVHSVPMVVMDLEDDNDITPVSFWYFSDVNFAESEFTEDAIFFYNCKENPISLNLTPTAPNCGQSDGQIAALATGGNGTFSYEWNTGATTATLTGVTAGTYAVIATDERGCVAEAELILNNQGAASIALSDVANITCFGANDGTATPILTGGTAPFTFAWGNGETDSVAIALPAGTTSLAITDANGCVSLSSVAITEPGDITVSGSAVNILCPGDTTGSATAVATGGSGGLTYLWSGTGETGSTLNNLAAGNYTVVVTDINGCQDSTTITVGAPAAFSSTLLATPNTRANPPYNGNIAANISGGTDPYTYVWTGPDGFTDNKEFIFQLCGGEYFLTVTDANNCTFSDTVTVGIVGQGANCVADTVPDAITTLDFAALGIFPNPTRGQFQVEIELHHAQAVRMEVYDFRGQLVRTLDKQAALLHTESFDLSQEAAGIYLVKITSAQGTVTRKLMLE